MSRQPIQRRVECPHCGRRIAVTGWGRMNKHLIEPKTNARCPGSGRLAPGFEWLEKAS